MSGDIADEIRAKPLKQVTATTTVTTGNVLDRYLVRNM